MYGRKRKIRNITEYIWIHLIVNILCLNLSSFIFIFVCFFAFSGSYTMSFRLKLSVYLFLSRSFLSSSLNYVHRKKKTHCTPKDTFLHLKSALNKSVCNAFAVWVEENKWASLVHFSLDSNKAAQTKYLVKIWTSTSSINYIMTTITSFHIHNSFSCSFLSLSLSLLILLFSLFSLKFSVASAT